MQRKLFATAVDGALYGFAAYGTIYVYRMKPVHHAVGPRTVNAFFYVTAAFVNAEFPRLSRVVAL